MFDYKFLGSRIRAVRLEKKITQEKLAANAVRQKYSQDPRLSRGF